MKRPLDWPRYMKVRHLADGLVAYYWVPHERDVAAGFTLKGEPLGKSYGDAIEGAHMLNTHLDAWREGRGTERNLDQRPGFGIMAWLFERCLCSPAFGASRHSWPEYVAALVSYGQQSCR
jgi:hypothetical protein